MIKKYHIITLGCSMNHSDSSRLSAYLLSKKLEKEDDFNKSDLIIINTCGIRQSAEDRAYSLVSKIRKSNKVAKLVITGCLSQRQDVKKRLASKVDLFLPISAISDILFLLSGQKIKSKLSLDEVRLMQGEKYLTILPELENKFSAFVPIGNGCNNFCSYCVVPYARGREVYRPAGDIIKEVKGLIKKGYKEIILIAQNVNSYKHDDYKFPELLDEISDLKGDFWLRFSSSHPKDLSLKLISVLKKKSKICPHLHLALQSGDDKILKAMNRRYTANKYLSLLKKVRQARPEIAITTDIIVGFPGETRENFKNTYEVFKKGEFDLAYISRYSPRPQTAAYLLKDNVSLKEKKRREKKLEELMFESAHNSSKAYENKTVKVLIEGKNRKGKYYGKTGTYKMVQLSPDKKLNDSLIGTFVNVDIKKIGIIGLEGSLVSEVVKK